MSEQIHKKATPKRPAPAADEVAETSTPVVGDKLKADIDDLLDEIDEVLETNADDFIKSYVQKGGQ